MKTKPYLLAIGCLCATLSDHGQGTTLFIPSSSVNLTTAPYQDHADFTFPTPAVSLANYGGIAVTFSAPAGRAWRFDPSIAQSLECYMSYGSPAESDGIGIGGLHFAFSFVAGLSSTVTEQVLTDPTWDGANCFGFDAHFNFGGVVEFTDLTVTTGHACWSLSEYQAQAPLGSFSQAYFDASALVPPGLTLVPIPEPSVAVLNVLMLACAGLRLNLT